MADDAVNVRFGADVSDLEIGLDLAKARVKETTKEFQDFLKTINQKMAGGGIVSNQDMERLRSSKAALNEAKLAVEALAGAGASVGKISAEFKEMSDRIAGAAFEYGPWTGAHIQAIQGAINGMVSVFGVAGTAAAAAGAVISAAFVAVELSAAKFAEQQGELAATLGISTERVGGFRAVARAAGQDVDQFANAMAALANKVNQGDKATATALNALGVSMASLKGQDPSAMLGTIADRVSELGDSYNKTAALQRLFGSAAEGLTPILDQGSDKLNALQAMAERTGITMSGALVQAFAGTRDIVDELGTNLQELGAAMRGLTIAIGSQIKGAVDGLVLSLSDLIGNIARATEQMTRMIGVSSNLTDSISPLAYVFNTVVSMIDITINAFQKLIVYAEDAAKKLGDIGRLISMTMLGVASDIKNSFESAFTGKQFKSSTLDALSDFNRRIWEHTAETKAALDMLQKQGVNQLNTIWSGGRNGEPEKRTEQAKAIPLKDNSGVGDAEKAARERLAAQQREIEGEIQLAKARLQQQQAIYNAEVQLKKIDEQEKIRLVMAATEAEYQTELGLLRREAALQGLKPAQVQAINNKIQQLQMQHQTQMLNLDVQSIQASQKEWQDHFDKVTSLFDGHIKGLITRSETLRSAFRSILLDMTMQLIQATEKMAVQWAVMEMAKTTATTSGTAARLTAEQSADSASMASNFGSILKAVQASASQTFAGIFGFLSPIMGPAAVGPAAAGEATVMGAAAALPSFAVGAWSLPSDMVAQVHQNEMIIPAGPAAAFRSMMSAGNAPSSGVTVHHTSNFNFSTIDGQSTAAFFRNNGKTLMRTINENVRSGVNLGMSKLDQ